MSYLIDADFVINALAKQKRAHLIIDQALPQGIAVSLITLGEIYDRAYISSNPKAYLDRFKDFLYPMRILNLNEPIVERFAELRAYLRKRGEIISDFDILIAATALYHNLVLLTFNIKDFKRIPDLRIYKLP